MVYLKEVCNRISYFMTEGCIEMFCTVYIYVHVINELGFTCFCRNGIRIRVYW